MKKSSIPTSTVAHRLQKPGWKDPKLLVGLALILLSVVSVIGVVRATNQTETFYALARDVPVGQKITVEDLREVDVRLSDSASRYMRNTQEIAEGMRAKDFLRSGELLRVDAVTTTDTDQHRKATVVLDSTVVSTFSAGDRVDIWISQKAENKNAYGSPEVVMQSAYISKVTSEESMIGSTGKSAVQLLVTEDALGKVLDATNNESKINLVPTSYAGEK